MKKWPNSRTNEAVYQLTFIGFDLEGYIFNIHIFCIE